MNILFFTDTFFPSTNGVVISILNTAEELARQGHYVKIIAPKTKHNTNPTHPNITYHLVSSIDTRVYPDLRLATPISPSTLKLCSLNHPDIIHFHTPITLGLQAILIAKLLHVPLVGTFHTYFMNPEYLKLVHMDKVAGISDLGWRMNSFFYNQADLVISPSEYAKEDLINNYIKKPIAVIENGINLPDRTKQPTVKFDLPTKYLLYIGRLSKEKNLEKLIMLFSHIAKSHDDAHLVIVGGGPEEESLRHSSDTLGITKQIHFMGYIDNRRLITSNIFDKAVAFVTTSMSEVQPISVLEAMSFGVPIIAYKNTVFDQIIKDNGVLCQERDPEDFINAVNLLYNDNVLQKSMGKKSIQLSSRYSIHTTTQKLLECYASLIDQHTK